MSKAHICTLLSYLLALGAGFFIQKDIRSVARDAQYINELRTDRTEATHVRYGLFSADSWKSQIGPMIEQRLEEFEIPREAIQGIEKYVADYLRAFYVQEIESGRIVDSFLGNQDNKEEEREILGIKIKLDVNSIIKKELKKYLENSELKDQIPLIASRVTDELAKNKDQIKVFLKQEIEKLAGLGNTDYTHPALATMESRYACSGMPDCLDHIDAEYNQTKKRERTHYIRSLMHVALLTLLLLALCMIGGASTWKTATVPLMTALCIGLLYPALSIPMIDLLAMLKDVRLNLLGAEVVYGDQTLYYQSKSILDVVQILIDTGQWDSKIVGFLILSFSIIFPIVKIISTVLAVYATPGRTGFFYKMATLLGKWSMADVFVVALLMAYIGFNGLLSTQIGALERHGGGYEISTYDETLLRPGALYFAGFVLVSLLLSTTLVFYTKKTSADYA